MGSKANSHWNLSSKSIAKYRQLMAEILGKVLENNPQDSVLKHLVVSRLPDLSRVLWSTPMVSKNSPPPKSKQRVSPEDRNFPEFQIPPIRTVSRAPGIFAEF